MDVFTAFQTVNYSFLLLKSGTVRGNVAVQEFAATGVLKTRDGMNQNGNQEAITSDATMHIRPTEAFIAAVGGNMIGHGIKAAENGHEQTYRIVGQRGGMNFDSGELEFYLVTLKREALAVDEES